MAYIGLQPQTQYLQTSTQIITADGVNLEYTLDRSVSKSADLRVFINGVEAVPEFGFEANGTQLLLDSVPTAGANIVISYVAGALSSVNITSNAYPVGSTTSPSIYSVDAAGTGIWWPSTTSVGITVAGNTRVKVSDDDVSTSTTTGALVVTGGAGVSGDLHLGGVLHATDTTQANNSSSGALIVSGGAGFAKDVYVGMSLQVAGDFTVAGAFTTTSSDSLTINDPFLFLANANPGDNLDSGVVSSYFDGSNTRYTGFFRDITDGKYKLFDNLLPEPSTTVDTANASFQYSDTVFGNVEVTSTIESSSTTTGALIVSGGVGVNGTVSLNAADNTVALRNDGTTGVGTIGASGGEFAAVYATTYYGDGSNLSGVSNYDNTNVATFITTAHTGNVRASSITKTGSSGSGDIGGSSSRFGTAYVTALSVNGTATATTFSGSGASLTTLDASQLSSGTVPSGRLTGAYEITATTANTFTTARTINGVSFNGGSNITVEPYVERDDTSAAARYITFVDSSTAGHQRMNMDTNLTYNPSTNVLSTTATQAQYADLAEKYEADAEYEPGTVLHFGGEKEVAQCDVDHCTRVAGVVSTNPAHLMNGALEAEHVVELALVGRVPCKVTGTVKKGDLMVSAGNGRARAEANPKVGAVIGKALADSEGDATIEVVVGKN